MFGRQKRKLNELTVLGALIDKMDKKGLDNPEYLIRNIELISNFEKNTLKLISNYLEFKNRNNSLETH